MMCQLQAKLCSSWKVNFYDMYKNLLNGWAESVKDTNINLVEVLEHVELFEQKTNNNAERGYVLTNPKRSETKADEKSRYQLLWQYSEHQTTSSFFGCMIFSFLPQLGVALITDRGDNPRALCLLWLYTERQALCCEKRTCTCDKLNHFLDIPGVSQDT